MRRTLLIGRHIEDLNDLHNNRNCGINPEKARDAVEIGNEILHSAQEEGASTILFVNSPKLRVMETVAIARNHIRHSSDLRTLVIEEPGIREIDQGTFNLPADYVVGMHIPELMDAWNIFWQQTFTHGDFMYRFGSKSTATMTDEFPELGNFFETPGENYTEYSLRLYESAAKLLHNTRLIRRQGVKVAVMTHSAPLAIFRELHTLAGFTKEGVEVPVGTLMQACWDAYQVRTEHQDPGFGHVDCFALDMLDDPILRDRLDLEIEYLKRMLKGSL